MRSSTSASIGPTALASVIERSGRMTLATTVALVALRGPVALAKALAAIDLLSDGRSLTVHKWTVEATTDWSPCPLGSRPRREAGEEMTS